MNEIRLYGSCGNAWWDEEFFTAAQVREQLAAMSGPVTVRINSGGGIAAEGQAIYTMLVDYPGEVHVVIDAVAMSSASLIAMAGDTITMRLGSYMLVHDPASPCAEGRGTEADHVRAAQALRVIADAYAAVYAKRAGIGAEEARRIMRDETVMDGPTALALGFATAIDDSAPAEPVARFDYRIYAHAPQALREASKSLGEAPGQTAMMAMMSGMA
ncbi:Clp protease ClpP, partial [Sinirhodobacter ferrireducens]